MRADYLSPQQVIEYLRPGEPVTLGSFYRWTNHGVKGSGWSSVVLKATFLAGRKYVHIADLKAFITAMNPERKSELRRRAVNPPPDLAPPSSSDALQ